MSKDIEWVFYQDDPKSHEWYELFRKDTKDAKEVVVDYVSSGFRVSMLKEFVGLLDLPEDIKTVGVIAVDQDPLLLIDKDRYPIVWLLSEPVSPSVTPRVDFSPWGAEL